MLCWSLYDNMQLIITVTLTTGGRLERFWFGSVAREVISDLYTQESNSHMQLIW